MTPMAASIPDFSELQLNETAVTSGGNRLPCTARSLAAKFTSCFFKSGSLLRREEEQARDGETDFLVCHPYYGYLCVEAKGGGVGFDAETGEWDR